MDFPLTLNRPCIDAPDQNEAAMGTSVIREERRSA